MASANPSTAVSRNAKSKPKRVFDPVWEDGECTLVLNDSLSVRERIDSAFATPELLHERRLLTKEEMASTGYTELDTDKMYWIKTPAGRKVPGFMRLSAQFLKKHGFLQRIAPLQAKLLTEEFKTKAARSGNIKIDGTRFLLGLSIKPYHSFSSVQLAPLSKAGEAAGTQQFLIELTKIVSDITKLVIPDIGEIGREDRWHQKASMTIGSRDNHIYTNAQLNYTKEGESLGHGLKKFGGVHRDIPNDPTVLNAFLVLSHLTEDHFGGRFNVTSLNVTTPLLPYELLLFPARFFHCSTGYGPYSVPKGSPLRVPRPLPGLLPRVADGTANMRLCIPLWTTARLMAPELRWLNEHLYTSMSESIFESKAHHHEWMMRFYIVHEPEISHLIKDKISSEPGSGPQQLRDACQASEKNNDRSKLQELTKMVERNWSAEHYVSLFTYTDDLTNKAVTPSMEGATKTLDSLKKDNTEFEDYFKDMHELIKRVGGNSTEIPFWAKSLATQHKTRNRSKLLALRQSEKMVTSGDSDVVSDGPRSDDQAVNQGAISNAIAAAQTIDVVEQDSAPANLASLMDQLVTSTDRPADKDELTSAIVAMGTALKHLIAYTLKQAVVEKEKKSPPEVDHMARKNVVVTPQHVEQEKEVSKNLKRPSVDDAQANKNIKRSRTSRKPQRRDSCGRFTSRLSPSDTSDESDEAEETDEEYEIEKIVVKRPTKSGKPLYLIRWHGWGPHWDEWKSAEELEHAGDLVEEYERRCGDWRAESLKSKVAEFYNIDSEMPMPQKERKILIKVDDLTDKKIKLEELGEDDQLWRTIEENGQIAVGA